MRRKPSTTIGCFKLADVLYTGAAAMARYTVFCDGM